jgi:hypothetical protein
VWPELRHLAPETVEALAALERCAAESALEAAAARQRARFAERRVAALARCGIPWGEVSQTARNPRARPPPPLARARGVCLERAAPGRRPVRIRSTFRRDPSGLQDLAFSWHAIVAIELAPQRQRLVAGVQPDAQRRLASLLRAGPTEVPFAGRGARSRSHERNEGGSVPWRTKIPANGHLPIRLSKDGPANRRVLRGAGVSCQCRLPRAGSARDELRSTCLDGQRKGPICRHFERRERRDSNPRPPA